MLVCVRVRVSHLQSTLFTPCIMYQITIQQLHAIFTVKLLLKVTINSVLKSAYSSVFNFLDDMAAFPRCPIWEKFGAVCWTVTSVCDTSIVGCMYPILKIKAKDVAFCFYVFYSYIAKQDGM